MKVIDFLQFLFKLNLSKNKLINDIEYLRKEIKPLRDKLVPFTHEEIKLLSLKQSNFTKKKGFVRLIKGIFDSIYYENLIAYGIREYPNQQKLIIISSSIDEFIYIVKKDKVNVYMNNIEAGIIINGSKFYNYKNKLLGSIDGSDHNSTHSVNILGHEIGFITNPKMKSNAIARAFSFLKPMSVDEMSIFLCLTLINLIEEGQVTKVK